MIVKDNKERTDYVIFNQGVYSRFMKKIALALVFMFSIFVLMVIFWGEAGEYIGNFIVIFIIVGVVSFVFTYLYFLKQIKYRRQVEINFATKQITYNNHIRVDFRDVVKAYGKTYFTFNNSSPANAFYLETKGGNRIYLASSILSPLEYSFLTHTKKQINYETKAFLDFIADTSIPETISYPKDLLDNPIKIKTKLRYYDYLFWSRLVGGGIRLNKDMLVLIDAIKDLELSQKMLNALFSDNVDALTKILKEEKN